MDELKKVRRVVDKAMPGCPHETWMVLDATTGQNAITQAKTFKDAMEITGIVITKLDGSAKGGVILGICDELKVPVRYIGVGEQLQDLRPFDAAAFVAALYDDVGPPPTDRAVAVTDRTDCPPTAGAEGLACRNFRPPIAQPLNVTRGLVV
jgi:hypothetical protein